jgi:hypothetical protein
MSVSVHPEMGIGEMEENAIGSSAGNNSEAGRDAEKRGGGFFFFFGKGVTISTLLPVEY